MNLHNFSITDNDALSFNLKFAQETDKKSEMLTSARPKRAISARGDGGNSRRKEKSKQGEK
jgi:hypothetical protein